MKILHRPVGQLATNCFLLIDEETKCGALIDPGENAAQLAELVRENGVTLTHILLTHGHYDHTIAVPALHEEFPEAAVYIHEADAAGTGTFELALVKKIDGLRYYDEGDQIHVGNLTLDVLHTPGHTKGCVVLKVGTVLFTGDTLFAGSCGRVDLPGGDWKEMLHSLKRLSQLEGDYTVLPGHGEGSYLSRERESNMYMKQAMR